MVLNRREVIKSEFGLYNELRKYDLLTLIQYRDLFNKVCTKIINNKKRGYK